MHFWKSLISALLLCLSASAQVAFSGGSVSTTGATQSVTRYAFEPCEQATPNPGGFDSVLNFNDAAIGTVASPFGFGKQACTAHYVICGEPNAASSITQAGGGSGSNSGNRFVKITYTAASTGTAASETKPGPEATITVSAGNVMTIVAPGPVPGMTDWWPYVSTTTGTETKQVTTGNCTLGPNGGCAPTSNWVEPAGGLTAGTNPPSTTACRNTSQDVDRAWVYDARTHGFANGLKELWVTFSWRISTPDTGTNPTGVQRKMIYVNPGLCGGGSGLGCHHEVLKLWMNGAFTNMNLESQYNQSATLAINPSYQCLNYDNHVSGCRDCYSPYSGASTCSTNNPTYWKLSASDSRYTFTYDTNYCFEWHLKANTPGVANGIEELFVTKYGDANTNGVLFFQQTDALFEPTGETLDFATVWIGEQLNSASINSSHGETRSFKNFSVTNNRVGCR